MSTLCHSRAAVATFTTISCLHLNERGSAIPGDIQQLRVDLLLTGAPTPAKDWLTIWEDRHLRVTLLNGCVYLSGTLNQKSRVHVPVQ